MIAKVQDELKCIEFEHELLGVLIRNPDFESEVRNVLFPEHFSDSANRLVYETILKMLDKGQTVSLPSLIHVMSGMPEATDIVAKDYLQKLCETVPSTSVQATAAFLREIAIKKSILKELSITNDLIVEDRTAGAEEIANLASEKLFQLVQSSSSQNFASLKQPLDSSLEHVNKLRTGAVSLLNTGFTDLDRKILGFNPSDLIILAGRPAMGKTALALSIAGNIAERYRRSEGKSGGSVAIVSLEMSAEQLALRFLARDAEVDAQLLRSAKYTDHDWKNKILPSVARIADLPIYIDDSPYIPIETLAARMRRLKSQRGLSLLIIDYLQLMQANPTRRAGNRNEEISEISRQLKILARRLNVPVLVLSQLSRNVEYRDDKRPMLADLRDSGSIEQDADLVLFVYRDEYYLEREEPASSNVEEHEKWRHKCEQAYGKAEIIIGKQRQGPTGRTILNFEPKYTVFRNLLDESSLVT